MSEFSKIPLGQDVEDLHISPAFAGYSRVVIITGQDKDGNDVTVSAGNTTGRTLTIRNEFGTAAQAQEILSRIRGFAYQPFKASGALLHPAAELGDAITVSGTYSGIYRITRTFDAVFAADVEAPEDEELDHEYPYEPQADRVYKREIGRASAQIRINSNSIAAEVLRASSAEGILSASITQTANAITSEVTRAKNAEGTLSSRITQNADSISAKVSKSVKTQIGTQTFGWLLESDRWLIQANGQNVLTATKDGLTVSGTITAKSGYIGNGSAGFTISASAIYNGKQDMASEANGVYIGTDGISLGSAFSVTKAGAVTAKNLALSGGSISISRNVNGQIVPHFSVTSTGKVSCKDIDISGGTITIKRTVNNQPVEAFKVTDAGAVTCRDLTVYGGKLNIGAFTTGSQTDYKFKVSDTGKVTINDGTIKIMDGSNLKFQVTDKGKVTINSGAITIKKGSSTVFKVDDDGDVQANDMKLTGTLTLGNTQITAENLRKAAERTNSGYSSWNGTTTTVGNMTGNTGVGALRCTTIVATNFKSGNDIAKLQEVEYVTGITVIRTAGVVTGVTATTKTKKFICV